MPVLIFEFKTKMNLKIKNDNIYRCLENNVFKDGKYWLVPIRMEDKYSILEMRNEQIYHLRQLELLTTDQQDIYFNNVVSKLFEKEEPDQILFSFLSDGELIGYGGLVHINWLDKNAEVSFIMKTAFERNNFQEFWTKYLGLISMVAFKELGFHKIFTFAFDVRPHLYDALEEAGFKEETRLREHALFDGKFIDVVIHSRIGRNDSI